MKIKYQDTYNDTFVYWLERRKSTGGAIGSGNSSKFYIYMDDTGEYCIGYGAKKRYIKGDELKAEYNKLNKTIVEAINLAKENKISEIRNLNCPLWNMVLLKILSLYVPDKFMDIFSSKVLIPLAEILSLDIYIIPENIIEINYEATKKLLSMDEFRGWSISKLSEYIYSSISNRERKPVYWVLGHNYGEGSIINSSIKNSNCDNNIIRSMGYFSDIKKGDIVLLKSSFTSGPNKKLAF